MGMELEAYLSRPNAISLTKLAAETEEVTGGELSASALCSVIARARAA